MRNTNIDKPIYNSKTTDQRLADRETYELLLDDYIDGVDVRDGESPTDYLKRKGFKGISDEGVEAKVKSKIKLASDYTDPLDVEMDIASEQLGLKKEYEKALKRGFKGSFDKFLDTVDVEELDARIRFFNSGGSVKSNGKAKDKPFTTAIEQKYKILLSGDETLSEVLELIKNQKQ